jgi:hypothetical protein
VWIFRPVVWFATAYTTIIILHESAHALAAYALGLHPTLFQFWVSFDHSRATEGERALVGVAGPTISLMIGLASWLAYRRAKNSQAGLPLCYLAAAGVSNFFGNLMSAAFVGDFSNAAVLLNLSPAARYTASFIGAASVSAILFWTGSEIRQWTPKRVGRLTAGVGAVVLPAIAGTAIVVLINQPVSIPISFGAARAAESAFWLFALIAVLFTRKRTAADETRLGLHWGDGVVALVVFLIVRILVRGVEFP